jgi:hypothetical protein
MHVSDIDPTTHARAVAERACKIVARRLVMVLGRERISTKPNSWPRLPRRRGSRTRSGSSPASGAQLPCEVPEPPKHRGHPSALTEAETLFDVKGRPTGATTESMLRSYKTYTK